MEMVISIIAVVASFISIVVAIVCAVITFIQNRKINDVNIKAKYFEKIFDPYLIDKIPQARKYLRFENNRLVDGNELSNVLSELMNAALYFRYDNINFYKQLKESVRELDDYIMNNGNIESEQEEQGQVFLEIQRKLEKLYKCINDHSVGR